MIYPYKCRVPECGAKFEVVKPVARAEERESCPLCGSSCGQDYAAKNVTGYISTAGDWSGGKRIYQLPEGHPDANVTNRDDMADAYKRNGICMDTGKFVSREAQIKATLPPSQQEAALNNPDLVVGGVREEA